jgi:hypothetical protein
MTEPGFRSLARTAARAFEVIPRLLAWAAAVWLVLAPLNVVAHTYLHVCPLHLAHFERRAIVRVVYGRPLGGELFEKAARGKIVLGGCVKGPVTGVCPYCRWPASFR